MPTKVSACGHLDLVAPSRKWRKSSLDLVGNQRELRQPRRRLAVTRRTVVASRRERAARPDLRPVRDTASLELAELEEPEQERLQMLLDLAQVVLAAPLFRDLRPGAALDVGPDRVSQERHLRR